MPLESKSAKPQATETNRTGRASASGGQSAPFEASALPALSSRDFVKILPQQIASLQRSVGNQTVATMLGRNQPSGKLRVGPARDRYEDEADRVARQVVTGVDKRVTAIPSPTVGKVQKMPADSIQRQIDVEEFRNNTNKGTFRQRGDVLSGADTFLKLYASYPMLVQNDSDRDRRKRVIENVRYVVDKWIERHDVTRMDHVTHAKKKNERADKLAEIVAYLKGPFKAKLDYEIQYLDTVNTIERMNQGVPVDQQPPEDPKRGEQMKNVRKNVKKANKQAEGLKSKFKVVKTDTGKFFGSVLPTMLRLLAPGPGDLGKFDFQIEIPLESANVPWFVGGRIYLESEAKESNEFKSKFKGALRTGPKLGSVKLALETGFQIEAQAQSPEEVSKLFSWGIYRRFRESKGIPRGVTNAMWGGAKGTTGYMNAEEWAAGVEKDVFNTGKNNEKAYVDLGGYASGQAEGSVGVAKMGGELFGYKGRKYTQHTIQERNRAKDLAEGPLSQGYKPEVGKTEYSKRGAQKSRGQGSRRYELGFKAGVKPWAGDVKFKYESVKALPTEDNIKKGVSGSYVPHKYELEINNQVTLPLGGSLAERIASSAGPGIAKMIRDVAILVQARKAKKETGEMGGAMFAGQLGEVATGFETNVEYNQVANSGLGSGLGGVDPKTGAPTPSTASTGAEMEGGFRFRLKIAQEYALDRAKPKSIKAEGSLYSINIMGGSFMGNKLKLDRGSRIGQLKWEKNKKIRFELFGIAGVAEKKKDNPNDKDEKPSWHKMKYQQYEAPVKAAPR